MCISAEIDGDNAQYILKSTGSQPLGWMAMGFGTTMANAAMVIMWPNNDGTITLSQRTASGEVMPTFDSNPPRVATQSSSLSILNGTNPQLVFDIPANSDTQQNIVWAFGTQQPSSRAVDATIQKHFDSGPLVLDLTKPFSSNSGASSTPSSHRQSFHLAYYQKLIIAHAILCTVGFLLLLPAGALLARYFRTFTHKWFQGHWIVQFALGGSVIFVGVILGIQSVALSGSPHLADVHKRYGIALFVLYLAQCGLGAFIHWVKPKVPRGRPPQNYMHAVLGLTIIALAFYQVRTGFKTEWPTMTGLAPLPYGVDVLWYAWIVILPVLYTIGMAFLPRQFAQEKPKSRDKEYAIGYFGR